MVSARYLVSYEFTYQKAGIINKRHTRYITIFCNPKNLRDSSTRGACEAKRNISIGLTLFSLPGKVRDKKFNWVFNLRSYFGNIIKMLSHLSIHSKKLLKEAATLKYF